MPAKQPQPDPEAALLAAIRRWRLADEAHRATTDEVSAARADVVAALLALGIKGFSL